MFGWGRDTAVNTDQARIDEVLTRSVVEAIDAAHIRKRLESGEKLRIKLGIDPTSPHIHLGRAVQLLKLRDFQALGHQIVLIVGDATGVIGDTSDKDSERPMLTPDAVKENMQAYLEQAGAIIDVARAEVRYNSEWLNGLTLADLGELADQFSVAEFIARDNIRRRLDAGTRVSLREMLYPLMQGYDSVAIRADIEIGGTDQRFNLLAGRVLQQHAGQAPQDIITHQLLPGTDGRKMSSSWGNTINLTDTPADVFGKIMRIPDELIWEYFEHATRIAGSDIAEKKRAVEAGANPRDAKLDLAEAITALIHDETQAADARARFIQTFSKQQAPDDMPVEVVAHGATLLDALVAAGAVLSRSEGRRLIAQGAVHDIDTGEALAEADLQLTTDRALKIGKRTFLRINVR